MADHSDFNTRWFVEIGSAVVVTIVGQMISATLTPVVIVLVVHPLRVRWAQRGLVTETALRQLFTLPDWTLSLRLAQTMTIITCLMMYSGATPVLYLIGFLYCFMAYWCDKYCLLRGSRQPPAYNQEAVRKCLQLLQKVAALAHLSVTLGVYGNQGLFPSKWWNGLRGFVQALFHMSEEQYNETRWIFSSSHEDLQQQYLGRYITTRCIDVAHIACVPVLMLFLLVCGEVSMKLCSIVLRPCCSWRPRLSSLCCGVTEGDQATKETYDQAKLNCEKNKVLFSYRIDANQRYQEAHAAHLKFQGRPGLKKSATRDGSSSYLIGERRLDQLENMMGAFFSRPGADADAAAIRIQSCYRVRKARQVVEGRRLALAQAQFFNAQKWRKELGPLDQEFYQGQVVHL